MRPRNIGGRAPLLAVALAAWAMLGFAAQPAHAVVFTATATLDTPTGTYHYQAPATGYWVPYQSSNQTIEITGAGSGQEFYLAYTFHLEKGTAVLVAADDDTIINCDGMGYWLGMVYGTGSMSVGDLEPADTYTGKAYTSFYDHNNMGNNDTRWDGREYYVVTP